MKKMTLFTILCFAFTTPAIQITGYQSLRDMKELNLQVSYQGGCLEHQISLELDPVCDDSGAVAGTLLDSGFADTCDSQVFNQTLNIRLNNYNLNCSPKVIYIFAAPKRTPVRIQL